MNFFEYWREVRIGSWENSVDAMGKIMIAHKRLKKLCDLEKKLEGKTKKGLDYILEEQYEAEKQLKLLKHYEHKLKRRKKKGEDQILLSSKIKDIIHYARKKESYYSQYIGALPDYFPDKEKNE